MSKPQKINEKGTNQLKSFLAAEITKTDKEEILDLTEINKAAAAVSVTKINEERREETKLLNRLYGKNDLENFLLIINQYPRFLYDSQNHEGQTFLHLACQDGKLDFVEALYDKTQGAIFSKPDDFLPAFLPEEVSVLDDSGRTPLHIAVINNQTEIAKFILSKKTSEVLIRDHSGKTAFNYADENFNQELIDEIEKPKAFAKQEDSAIKKVAVEKIESGKKTSGKKTKTKNKPDDFDQIIAEAKAENARLLKEQNKKESSNQKSPKSPNPDLAIVKEVFGDNYNPENLEEDLIYAHLFLDIKNKRPLQAISIKIKWLKENSKHRNEIDQILEREDKEGDTAFLVACRLGNFEAAEILLENGANLLVSNKINGFNALHLCSALQDKNAIKVINRIFEKAELSFLRQRVNFEQANHNTSFICCLLTNFPNREIILSKLLEKGCDPNELFYGKTLLEATIESKNIKAAEVLIADPRTDLLAKDNNGISISKKLAKAFPALEEKIKAFTKLAIQKSLDIQSQFLQACKEEDYQKALDLSANITNVLVRDSESNNALHFCFDSLGKLENPLTNNDPHTRNIYNVANRIINSLYINESGASSFLTLKNSQGLNIYDLILRNPKLPIFTALSGLFDKDQIVDNETNKTFLHIAIENENFSAVANLIILGHDLLIKDSNGLAPINLLLEKKDKFIDYIKEKECSATVQEMLAAAEKKLNEVPSRIVANTDEPPSKLQEQQNQKTK
ncbi:MAG: ankyrin repeat domain-containing protein [Rickettsiales bacterium]|nr:ankyrin repeat domain-containing protein [Rickettsiales bacterium]